MNANMLLWVEELRSGRYRQGTGRLRDTDNKFCCLGVACDLFFRTTGKGRWVPQLETSSFTFMVDDNGSDVALPKGVRDWLGLASASGGMKQRIHNGVTRQSLTNINDDGVSFDEIANIIESDIDQLIVDEA